MISDLAFFLTNCYKKKKKIDQQLTFKLVGCSQYNFEMENSETIQNCKQYSKLKKKN
jgi:hypothetical protein